MRLYVWFLQDNLLDSETESNYSTYTVDSLLAYTHTHKLCMLLHRDKCKSMRCVKMILQPLFCHITQRKKLTPEKPWGMTHAYHLTESGTLFWTPQVTKNKKIIIIIPSLTYSSTKQSTAAEFLPTSTFFNCGAVIAFHCPLPGLLSAALKLSG